MSIKEIIESTILLHGYKTVYIGRPYEVINSQFVHKQQVDKLELLMKEYVKSKCREQRELCSKSFPSHEQPDILKSVFNAPEPKFD